MRDNLNAEVYKAGDSADRLRVLNSVEDVQFQARNYNVELTDREIERNINTVVKMDNVVMLHGNEITFGDGSLKRKVLEFFKDNGGKVYNKILGDVELNSRSFRDEMGHGMYPLKAITFHAIPEVLKKGEIINYSPNWEKRKYRTYIIAAPIGVSDGVYKGDYWMGVIVKADANMQNLYTHDVAVIDKKDLDTLRTGASAMMAGVSGDTKSSLQSILKKLNDVNPDIQYQPREESEDVSVRRILANMMEAETTDPEERAWLERYRGQLGELEMVLDAIDGNKRTVRELLINSHETKDEEENAWQKGYRADLGSAVVQYVHM